MLSLRISELAARSGVPASTLRFYESAGLLPADRTPSGYRAYDQDAVERLRFILEAKQLGLPLPEIAELLTVWESGACSDVRADLRPRLAARIADAEERLSELTAFTASLHQARRHLDALPDRAGRCDPECGFLNPATAPPPSVPIACALDREAATERKAQWTALLEDAIREPVSGGLRLTLPATRAAAIAEIAVAEQRCCPFFEFQLQLDGATVTLLVRAPADAAPLLAGLFG